MKRRNESFRESIMSSKKKRQMFGVLLEELSKPEIELPQLSSHTSMVLSHINAQNATLIPSLLKLMQKQRERQPIVLQIKAPKDIFQNEEVATTIPDESMQTCARIPQQQSASSSLEQLNSVGVLKESVIVDETPIMQSGNVPSQFQRPLEESIDVELNNVSTEESQFEIIFADSTRTTGVDNDNDHHVIHSIIERPGSSSRPRHGDHINASNSFPLFQLEHTGEMSDEMKEEIERTIRQANPLLDLNSLTFKIKSPQRIEIIANLNS